MNNAKNAVPNIFGCMRESRRENFAIHWPKV